MTSIYAWRFSHMATDIKKLRSSTIPVMQLELVMRCLSSLPNTVFSSMLLGCWSEHSASHIACNALTESYGCFAFIVRTSSAKEDRAMTRSNWDR
jgi:hypothetical protein